MIKVNRFINLLSLASAFTYRGMTILRIYYPWIQMETESMLICLKNLFLFMKKKKISFGIIECLGMIKMKYSKDFIFIGVSIGKDINEWMGCSKIK